MTTILGISLGTRCMGIALLRNDYLTDYRTKTFKETWSPIKLKRILRTLERIIIHEGVTELALKLPHPKRSSLLLTELQKGIRGLAESNEIGIQTFYIEDIKSLYQNQPNKMALAEYVCQKHPHLCTELRKEQEKSTGYYLKMFEAVAVAQLIQ